MPGWGRKRKRREASPLSRSVIPISGTAALGGPGSTSPCEPAAGPAAAPWFVEHLRCNDEPLFLSPRLRERPAKENDGRRRPVGRGNGCLRARGHATVCSCSTRRSDGQSCEQESRPVSCERDSLPAEFRFVSLSRRLPPRVAEQPHLPV